MRHEIRILVKYLQRALVGLLLLGASAAALAYAGASEQPSSPSWAASIRAMDEALARGDMGAALRARQAAHRAALGSRGWEGLAAVGDASLRLGNASGLRPAMEPEARRAYLLALSRAWQQGSADGVLHATLGFLTLGDRDVARRGLAIADGLAARSQDQDALERVRALQEQMAAGAPLLGGTLGDPKPGGANAVLIP